MNYLSVPVPTYVLKGTSLNSLPLTCSLKSLLFSWSYCTTGIAIHCVLEKHCALIVLIVPTLPCVLPRSEDVHFSQSILRDFIRIERYHYSASIIHGQHRNRTIFVHGLLFLKDSNMAPLHVCRGH